MVAAGRDSCSGMLWGLRVFKQTAHSTFKALVVTPGMRLGITVSFGACRVAAMVAVTTGWNTIPAQA